jgi:spermidine synthase
MNHNLKSRHLIFTFIIMGFSAMMTQVVTLRELIIVFTGNELTLGIILGIWLLWTAVGSGLISRLIPRLKHPLHTLIFCQLIIVILLPITLVFIRTSKQIFSLPIGEIAPPYFIFIIPAFAFAPICMLFGFLYALGCKLFAQAEKEFSLVAGRVYLLEGIGAGIAGFIASIIFFRYLENFQIVTIICIVNIFVAFFLLSVIKKKLVFLWILAIPLFSMLIILFFPRIDRFSNQKAWGALQLLRSQNSIHGNIAVTQLGESTSFYDNGALMFTNPDVMSAEESVHFALLEHPSPQTVLLIGGDPAGSLPQILYHPSIAKVDFVTLNPATIQLAEDVIPALADLLQDKRIHVWYQDGRLFLKQREIKYDVIIINLPEPQTTMINRFYTLEFYQTVRQQLNSNGVLSFSLPSSENVLSNEQQLFLSCLFNTMKSVFEDIVLIPGNSIHFVGCTSRAILTRNPQILVERLNQRELPTVYMREYYIPFRMSEERMEFISNQIQQTPSTIINRDFQPIAYFYNIILWMTSFNLEPQYFLTLINKWGIYILVLTFFLIILIWSTHLVRERNNISSGVLMTILGIGFTSISLEVLIILGFQAIYGYAYYQLSLIISGFMIGLTIGSWFGITSVRSTRAIFSRFLLFQFLLIIYPLITFISLLLLSKTILPGFLIQVIFLLLIFGVGFIAGFQFPVANHLILRGHEHVEIIGGTLYAWDLAGSVVGAILTSTLLIPIMGIRNTIVLFSILNLIIFLMLVLSQYLSQTKSIKFFTQLKH